MSTRCGDNANDLYCTNVGKNAWPELCGRSGTAAVATIRQENPSKNPVILLEGTAVTSDINCDRVRVWVNRNGTVILIPVVG